MSNSLIYARLHLGIKQRWRHRSVRLARLLIVQEDNISASVGQMIVAEMCSHHAILQGLKTPPVIVSKDDVHVGFNPIYEYAALPDQARIAAALERLLSTTLEASLQFAVPRRVIGTNPY